MDVLLPLPMRAVFSYGVPEGFSPVAGMRAIVPFGKNKRYTGVVKAVYESDAKRNLKFVEEFPDDFAVVTPPLLRLYEWMADYYLCGEGEALKASLPAGLQTRSDTTIQPAEGLDL
ncbi:MAG: primosomal protein N', partial [Bacteroidia bacterium]|nr:primosomal protein N' [Bacteroidia bacterium]